MCFCGNARDDLVVACGPGCRNVQIEEVLFEADRVLVADGRPSFQAIYLGLAEALSGRATCKRLKVGTVITTTDYRKVLAVGYNGNAAGLPNCCDRDEPGNCGCLHSEENAVINCDTPRYVEKFVFVTHLPCSQCAKRLINLGGVQKVFYKNEYRTQTAKELFAMTGIALEQLP